eukprot:11147986-Prorocentrum_lima.AAC.1
MEALPKQDMSEVSADASFAPGGERSRAGVVVNVYGVILGVGVRQWLKELLDPQVTTVIEACHSE